VSQRPGWNGSGVSALCASRAKAIAMKLQPGQIPTPGGFGRSFDFLLRVLLYTTMAAIAPPAVASDSGDHPMAVHEQTSTANDRSEVGQPPKQDHGPEPTTSAAAPDLCEALATSAKANDLPLDFFTGLIWQERPGASRRHTRNARRDGRSAGTGRRRHAGRSEKIMRGPAGCRNVL
jgi:hypothetical protein